MSDLFTDGQPEKKTRKIPVFRRLPAVSVGDRFGRLVVVELLGRNEAGHQTILVKCDCGSEPKSIRLSHVFRGEPKTVSCGCYAADELGARTRTHNKSHSRVYKIWRGMKDRILNPSKPDQFKNYGGRGLDIDPRWAASFESFYQDMGDPPTPKHSIERSDNSVGYWPTNCVWATALEQAQNMRTNVNVIVDGATMTITQARKKYRVSAFGIWRRVYRVGETHQEAIDHFIAKKRQHTQKAGAPE